MGVPKFFRYISERYPCLSEIVKEYQIPEFDNLYLDMNGIIHTCSHPDDGDPHFRITEEKIFEDIFHYIEVLFRMIKPRKLFFMAVDGVAPRAKMNQQRGRRFNSAKEAERLENAAKRKGETLPTEARFDSNCITPGTPFMARLHEQLKYFVVNKLSTDRLWSKCKIILSGHETPGEGEHKIMDYIRYLRSQPGYDPNTRHCLYGLDADLIMLGLCTHEPHFSLLREEIKFGKKANKRKNVPEEITFFLLHLSLMREYLELEFQALKDCLTFEFNIENIIDDWVLMGFLVGNDFIPNLPNLHISNGALPLLYATYMKVLPTLGGYINEAGTLNLARFEQFMAALGEIDMEHFTEHYADLKYFEAKTGRRPNEKERTSYKPIDEVDNIEMSKDAVVLEPSVENLKHLALEPDGFEVCGDAEDLEPEDIDPESDVSSSSEPDFMSEEFRLHKRDYYMNKLEYEHVTPEVLRDQAEGYVKAIQWNLNYYYNGCCSWSWYYPHHYAPYISDIKGFSDLKIEFELGQPFKPFEQLLAVLPAASRNLLPACYQELMMSENSPIKHYYPEEFTKDLNGKKQDWEAVVLIPFIDQKLLLEVMEPLNEKLTEDEKKRNTHGPMLVYHYTDENLGSYTAPSYFLPVAVNHAHCETLSLDDIKVPIDKLIKGAYPGVKMDIYYPGFPTFKHLKYKARLEKKKVRVFEQASKGDNMIIKLEPRDCRHDDFTKMIGRTVHVGWPHLVEALIVAISTEEHLWIRNDSGTVEKRMKRHNVELGSTEDSRKTKNEALFQIELAGVAEHYISRFGIEIGETEVLVHVKVMTGRKYVFTAHGRATLEKQFATVQSHYPIQTIVEDISAYDQYHSTFQDISTIFPAGTSCFMLGHPHYGAMGEILQDQECLQKGRVKVQLQLIEEPNLAEIKQLEAETDSKYMSLFVACSKLSISRYVFSRITGTVFVVPRNQPYDYKLSKKFNVGLNLKFNVKNQETPGFTRKVNNNWLYSEQTVNLIKEYMQYWPEIFEYLNYHQKADNIILEDLFPEDSSKVNELRDWLKSKPHYNAERQTSGNLIMDPEIIQKLENTIDIYQSKESPIKPVVMMKVKLQFIYMPGFQVGRLPPDPQATYELCDRIVNVRDSFSVPIGAKGTIIGIRTTDENDKMYDVLFDKPFPGGFALNCTNGRGYRLPPTAMINISHGNRVYQEKTGIPGCLLQAVQTKKQNCTNTANVNMWQRNKGWMEPMMSAFAPWDKMGPRMPERNFFPVFNARAGFVPPMPPTMNINVTYNPSFMAQTTQLKTVILKHDSPRYQSNLSVKQKQIDGRKPQNDNGEVNVVSSGQSTNSEGPRARTAPPSNTTDVLKKMLKINQAHNQKIPATGNVERQPVGKSISVDEVFAKAKSMSDSGQISNRMKLTSYLEEKQLGCPKYQYFINGNTTTTKVTIPGGRTFVGKPCFSREEASESAAYVALRYLMKQTNLSPKKSETKPKSPKTFPTPPKQWYNTKSKKAKDSTQIFVPLQAVRGIAQVLHSPKKKDLAKSSGSNVENAIPPKGEQSVKVNESPAQIKRRGRKPRIAANFSKRNVEVNS